MSDDPDNPGVDHNLDEDYEVILVGITTPESEDADDAGERRRCRNYVLRFADGRVYRTGYVYR